MWEQTKTRRGWNIKNGSVPLGDTEMEYVSFGRGVKQLILLPGLSDGLATVKGRALLLAAPYRIFCEQYTVYVFSRKNKLPDGYTIREMAADQAAAMGALGIESACVMGVSQGGMLAQTMAIEYPALVEKLVLAVTAPNANETVHSCVARWMALARQGNHRQLMIDTAEHSYSQRRLKTYRLFYPLLGLVGKPKDYHRFLVNGEAILKFDVRDELQRIACPTLILAGEEDEIVSLRASYEIKERIAGSELVTYPGLGHAAFEEAPGINERVLRFLET